MDPDALRGLLDDVASGELSPDDAVRRLSRLPFADVGAARIDHHRALRQGMPEAVYGPGKSPEQVAVVVSELLEHGTGPVVLSRADEDQVAKALAIINNFQRAIFVHGFCSFRIGCIGRICIAIPREPPAGHP